MNRACGLLALLVVAGLLSACAAGAPSAGPAAAPTATAAQVAAPPAATTAPPTPVPPTATAVPPTVPAGKAEPAAPAAPGFGQVDAAAELAQGERPPPPTDPGTGESVTVPDASTLESPLFGSDPNELQVALTFDAGADRGYAAEILDLLAAEGIKGSFGMTGKWAEAYPALVQRMADEGHMLFNHTYSHNSLIGLGSGTEPMTFAMLQEELERTEQIVRAASGYEMKPYFRAPFGEWDAERLGYLADAGYYLNLYWTCDSQGWRGWTADEINAYCTVNLKAHEVILLHVGAGSAEAPSGDYESLPGMIASFREQGYEFVTMEQMLQP